MLAAGISLFERHPMKFTILESFHRKQVEISAPQLTPGYSYFARVLSVNWQELVIKSLDLTAFLEHTSYHLATQGLIAAHPRSPTVATIKMKTTVSSFLESLSVGRIISNQPPNVGSPTNIKKKCY